MKVAAAFIVLALAACGGGQVGLDQTSDGASASAVTSNASGSDLSDSGATGTVTTTDQGTGSSSSGYSYGGSSSSGRYASESDQTTTTTGTANVAVTTTTSGTTSGTTLGGSTVSTTTPSSGTPPSGSYDLALQPFVDQAMADLSERLGVAGGSIAVLGAEIVTWPDASIGCPEPDMAYIQVPVDGSMIRLFAGGMEYRYHTGGSVSVPFLCEFGAE